MGRARAFCVVFIVACRTAQPPPTPVERPKPKPYDWHHDGQLNQAQGEARCAQTLPECKRRFVAYVAPPSPCARKGTLCLELPSPGQWVCACNQCANESDCPAGHFCSYGSDPCEQTEAARCVPGKFVPRPCVPKTLPQ